MEQQKINYLVPFSIIVAGVIVASAVWYTRAPSSAPSPVSESRVAASALLTARAGDLMLGAENAPVTIIEYGDFQCPFCGRFHQTISPTLREQYIKTGKVKFIWRDFAFLGQESTDAARAAHCAGEQEKFWDYHDYLFGHQNGENRGAFSIPNLKQFARAIGISQTEFDQCLDSQKYADTVASDTKIGREVGVNGTPTTFVNGERIVGLVSFATIEESILSALR